MTPADELLDATVRHQVGLLRYSNATVSKVLALLARVEADVVRQIRLLDVDSLDRQRLEAQLTVIRQTYRQGYDQLTGVIAADMADLAEYEAQFV